MSKISTSSSRFEMSSATIKTTNSSLSTSSYDREREGARRTCLYLFPRNNPPPFLSIESYLSFLFHLPFLKLFPISTASTLHRIINDIISTRMNTEPWGLFQKLMEINLFCRFSKISKKLYFFKIIRVATRAINHSARVSANNYLLVATRTKNFGYFARAEFWKTVFTFGR